MKASKGFTLIELLIVIALTAVITTTLFSYTNISLKLISKNISIARASQKLRFVVNRMSTDIIQSSGISSASSEDKMVIGDIVYEYRDGKIRRQQGNDIYYLTNQGEFLTMKFSYPSTKFVRMELTPRTGEIEHINVYARN